MKRFSEMIDLWIFTKQPDQIRSEQPILGHLIFGILSDQIAHASEYAQQDVGGVNLQALATSEQEKILEELKRTGKFEIEIEEIQPEDPSLIPYTCITAVYKDLTELSEALYDILVVAHQISSTSERNLPGF